MELARHIARLRASERALAEALVLVSERHAKDPEISAGARRLAMWSAAHVVGLEPFTVRYGRALARGPGLLRSALFRGARRGGPGLVEDLHDLGLLVHEVHLSAVSVLQAAQALKDEPLQDAMARMSSETDRQIAWVRTHLQLSVPQALTVPGNVASRMASLPTFPWGPAILPLVAACGLAPQRWRRTAAAVASCAVAAAAIGMALGRAGRRLAAPVAARQRLARSHRAAAALEHAGNGVNVSSVALWRP